MDLSHTSRVCVYTKLLTLTICCYFLHVSRLTITLPRVGRREQSIVVAKPRMNEDHFRALTEMNVMEGRKKRWEFERVFWYASVNDRVLKVIHTLQRD